MEEIVGLKARTSGGINTQNLHQILLSPGAVYQQEITFKLVGLKSDLFSLLFINLTAALT